MNIPYLIECKDSKLFTIRQFTIYYFYYFSRFTLHFYHFFITFAKLSNKIDVSDPYISRPVTDGQLDIDYSHVSIDSIPDMGR